MSETGTVIAGMRVQEPSGNRSDGIRRRGRKVDYGGTGKALRIAGLRDLLHPHDAVAIIYPDLDYFNKSARLDRTPESATDLNHNEVYGPYPVDGGLLGIVDMRPALRWGREQNRRECPDLPADPSTNPALPDECSGRCRCHREIWDTPEPASTGG